MKIHEVIYFTHELDMLEAHLEEHSEFVDKFIVKESPCLWSGPEKPLFFQENKSRFDKYNIEHIIIPPSEFDLSIPAKIPENEFKKWFDVRRHNRTLSRLYKWDEITKGADWLFSMDCDEIVSRHKFPALIEFLAQNKDSEHVSIRLVQHQFWINVTGKKLDLWRIFRGDIPYRGGVRGYPRISMKEKIGWHFTNCYSAEDLRLKALGICTHYGYRGVDDVPSVVHIQSKLDEGLNPFVVADGMNPGQRQGILPSYKILDGLDWAPKFMQENPERFPRYSY
jgi:hypothetical protein